MKTFFFSVRIHGVSYAGNILATNELNAQEEIVAGFSGFSLFNGQAVFAPVEVIDLREFVFPRKRGEQRKVTTS